MNRSRAAVLVAIASIVTAGLVPVAATPAAAKPAAAKPGATSRTHARAGKRPAPQLPVSYEGSGTGKRAVELLEWKNPHSRQLRKIVVRYARGSVAPKTVHRGHGVHLSKLRAQSAKLTTLVPNAGYSVSIFAVYRNGRASRPAVVRFTTPGTATKSTVRGTLRGVVTDSAGARLVRADVSAYDWDSGRSAETVTNADGAYVLGLPPGNWSVDASGSHAAGGNSDATGYTHATRYVVVRGNHTTAAPTLALPAGAAVSGRIVDIAKQPVVGAVPYLGPAATYDDGDFGAYSSDQSFVSFGTGPESVTGADGRFELRGIPAGVALALCGVGQEVRVAGKTVDLLSACQQRTHAVAAGHTLTLPDLALRTGAGSVVTGQLRNAKGRGLFGVVSLEDNSDDGNFLYTFTDSAGRYRLPGVARGRYRLCGSALTSAGSRTGYARSCTKPRVVGGSGAVRANRTLQRGAAATGTVIGPRGNRLAGIRVSVFSDDDGVGGGGGAVTNNLGQWRAVGLGKGKYHACFSAADGTSAGTGVQSSCWHGDKKFTVRVGRVRSGINTKLRAAAAVAGVVRDHTGKPLPYAEITVATPRAIADDEDDDEGNYGIADAAGRYRVTSVDNGTYRVCASDPDTFASGQAPEDDGTCGPTVRARAGATTTAPPLVLSQATAVVARVVDSTGTPVAGADVTSLAACSAKYCARTNLLGSARVDVVDSEITDADGRAVLAADQGHYAVCALGYFGTTVQGGSPTGYADACHGAGFDVTVHAHATTTVTITLADGGAVTGRVVDQTGRGVAGTRIVVPGSTIDDAPTYYYGLSGDVYDDFDDDGPSFDPVLPGVQTANSTDSFGRFQVIGVRPGQWSTCATDNGSDTRPRFADTCSGGAGATVTVAADTTTTANVTVTRR